MDAFSTAAMVSLFASPWVWVGVACLCIAAAFAVLAQNARRSMDSDYGDTHANPCPPYDTLTPMRTADAGLIDAQSREVLRDAWRNMSPIKQPIDGGRHMECCAPCSPRACDLGTHCARAKPGRITIMQRLSHREVAAIRLAAQEAAQEDHEQGSATVAAPERPNPMPQRTRAFAIWAVEYANHRDTLAQTDMAQA